MTVKKKTSGEDDYDFQLEYRKTATTRTLKLSIRRAVNLAVLGGSGVMAVTIVKRIVAFFSGVD